MPARQVQHLALDAAAQPARVALLDALGREMRALDAPGAAVGWPLAGLPTGTYLVRVKYATGPVTRQVVVE